MGFNKWFRTLAAGVLLSTSLSVAAVANAEEERTIADEVYMTFQWTVRTVPVKMMMIQ